MNMFTKFLGFLALIILAALIMAFPVKWLWNWLMPTIFNLTEITFWQALGLCFLSSALFKSNNSSSSK